MTELVVVIFTNIPSQYPPLTSTNNGQWNPGSNVDYCMQSWIITHCKLSEFITRQYKIIYPASILNTLKKYQHKDARTQIFCRFIKISVMIFGSHVKMCLRSQMKASVVGYSSNMKVLHHTLPADKCQVLVFCNLSALTQKLLYYPYLKWETM